METSTNIMYIHLIMITNSLDFKWKQKGLNPIFLLDQTERLNDEKA